MVNGPDTGRGLIFALDGGILDETRQTLARLFDLAPVTRPPQGWFLPNFRHQNQYAVGSQQLEILVALRAGYVRDRSG